MYCLYSQYVLSGSLLLRMSAFCSYKIGCKEPGKYRVVLDSDAWDFGGKGRVRTDKKRSPSCCYTIEYGICCLLLVRCHVLVFSPRLFGVVCSLGCWKRAQWTFCFSSLYLPLGLCSIRS